MDTLTSRQKDVLRFVKSHKRQHGYPPTRTEISGHFEWKSANAAQQHLVCLERKGYIRLLAGKLARGIVVLK